MRFRSPFAAVALGAATALTLAGCSSGGGATPSAAPTDDPQAALVAAAQAEGQVIVYSSSVGTIAEAAADAFTEKYGIEVLINKITSAEANTRYTAEATAGNIQADIVDTSCADTVFLTESVEKGWALAPSDLDSEGIAEMPDTLVADGNSFRFAVMPVAIGYNTDLLEGADIPKSWEDLTDAKYKGQIVMVDPESSAFYISWLTWILDKYGEDYLKELGENIGGYADAPGSRNQLGAGQYSVDIPTFVVSMDDTAATGAPVAGVVPDETIANYQCAVVSGEDGPHPNAAKLYGQFLSSQEGGDAVASVNGVLSPFSKAGVPSTVEPAPPAGDKDQILTLLGR